MKRITFSEVVDKVDSTRGPAELCAVAEAAFDEGRSKLIVQLDSHLRRISDDATDEYFSDEWLPTQEMLRESVSAEDACSLTREIFHNWTEKVRESIPEVMAV